MATPRVFVSYRRSDAAGHAGRLYDGLTARLGPHQVFQDVATIEPGTDFVQRVEHAIADSDATLVVIGPNWLAATDADGSRRIDEPDDYVRFEVAAALAGGGRVVPVLVAGGSLPSADELPEDVQTLAHRQAVRLHDETWQEDLDALVRQLQVEPAAPARRRRWPVVAGVLAVAVAGLGGWLLLLRSGAEGGASGGAELPPCPLPDATWQTLAVAPAAPVERDPGVWVKVPGVDVRVLPDEGEWQVVVQTDLDNAADSNGWEHESWNYEQLLVDRVPYGPTTCFTLRGGDANVDPGERSLGLVGFDIPVNPLDQPLALELDNGTRIAIVQG